MTKAPKNWRKVGYLIPEVIDPEENICVCVPVPKDWGHIRAFLGQLTELSKWLTWEKDGTDSAAQTARRWFEITECVAKEIDCIMASGCGCDDRRPTNARINPVTGLYEVSYDNGVTWQTDPGSDPRSSGVVFPGLSGSDGATKRCEAANSVVGFFEDLQQQEYDGLVANQTIAEFFALLVGVLTTLGIVTLGVASAVGAVIAFVVGLFAHMIPADFDSQFTNATWDSLLCIVFCNMQDDASFSETQWQSIKSQVTADIGGYAGEWLNNHINLLGVVGLTNAARSNYPGTRSCDDCICTDCVNFNILQGTLVSQSGSTLVVDSVYDAPNDRYFVQLDNRVEVGGDGTCCFVSGLDFGGATPNQYTYECSGANGFYTPEGLTVVGMHFFNPTAFTVTVVFG